MTLSCRGLRWTGSDGGDIGPIDAELGPGARVLLASRSGGGKSTLLRALAGLLGRHRRGTRAGTLAIGGDDPAELPVRERPSRVGFVPQEACVGAVSDTVRGELVFASECAGIPVPARAGRVAEVLDSVGLGHLPPDRLVRDLSGGEAIRLAVALALLPAPAVLLLDEPLASLDALAADGLLGALARVAGLGTAVVVAEHRVGLVAPWADRLWLMRDGDLVHHGPVGFDRLAAEGLVGIPLPAPTDAPEGPVLAWHRGPLDRGTHRGAVDIDVRAGQRWFLRGPNGAGKSTLLRGLRGIGRCLSVPQDADLALTGGTVADEVGDPVVRDALGLGGVAGRPSLLLSRGERVRVALGAALAARPDVLLLDEPTAGQDPVRAADIWSAVAAFAPAALVVATHDDALTEAWATDVCTLGSS